MSMPAHWFTGVLVFCAGMFYVLLLFLEEWLLLKRGDEGKRPGWPRHVKHG